MKFTLKEIVLTGIFAAVTAVLAQISVNIPPVPITFTIFGVFLSAVILGSKCGAFSQLVYILLGAFGLPVFQGFQGGLNIILSAKGGYIISFPLMAFAIGLMIERKKKLTRLNLAGMMIIGLILCYALGTSWLAYVMKLDAVKAVSVGIVPFLPLDMLKVIAAAFIGYQVRDSLIKANLI